MKLQVNYWLVIEVQWNLDSSNNQEKLQDCLNKQKVSNVLVLVQTSLKFIKVELSRVSSVHYVQCRQCKLMTGSVSSKLIDKLGYGHTKLVEPYHHNFV